MDWWETGNIREGVPFAVDGTGAWRDVDDVPNGKSCGCFCGDCRGAVVARQGEIRAHHFAHADRRECRNALEASLFGMAINLLQEPDATLTAPPHGDRRRIAISAGIASQHLSRLRPGEMLVPETHLTLKNAEFHVVALAESTPATPEIFLPDSRVAIHFLSVKKQLHQLREAQRDDTVSVLGLNLHAYAQLWWEVCDSRKEERIKAAGQARNLMRSWLADACSGRGWLYHAAVKQEETRLRKWLTDHPPKSLPSSTPLQPIASAKTRTADWTLPKREHHPEPAACGMIATANGLVPGVPQFMKRVREDRQGSVTDEIAVRRNLKWHSDLKTWFFVSEAESEVPFQTRPFLDARAAWDPVRSRDREKLVAPSRPFTPHAEVAPQDVELTVSRSSTPKIEPRPNELVLANVGTCYCGSPLDHVVLANGYFTGRRAQVCRREFRHPLKLLS